MCSRSIPYLTCKGIKNGKGSERFCTVCLFYGEFSLPPCLPPQFATLARPSLLRNNVRRFCAPPENSYSLRWALGRWDIEKVRLDGAHAIKYSIFCRYARNTKQRIDLHRRRDTAHLPRFLLSFALSSGIFRFNFLRRIIIPMMIIISMSPNPTITSPTAVEI